MSSLELFVNLLCLKRYLTFFIMFFILHVLGFSYCTYWGFHIENNGVSHKHVLFFANPTNPSRHSFDSEQQTCWLLHSTCLLYLHTNTSLSYTCLWNINVQYESSFIKRWLLNHWSYRSKNCIYMFSIASETYVKNGASANNSADYTFATKPSFRKTFHLVDPWGLWNWY